MPTPAFPVELRPAIQASKARTQPASFAMAEPRRGYGYAQAIGTDTPVFWDVQFRFRRADAVRFQLWFIVDTQRGLLEFSNFPIKTEFGVLEHTCRFLPDGLADPVETGEIWTFSAKIMARAQLVPDAYLDAAEVIIGLPNWDSWAEYLDLAVAALPEDA